MAGGEGAMKFFRRIGAAFAALGVLALPHVALAQGGYANATYGGAQYNGVFPNGVGGRQVALRILLAGSSYTLGPADNVLEVNKTSGSATAVVLPKASYGTEYLVVDGKGDAATNNITVSSATGALINGSSTSVINTGYGSRQFFYDGARWLAR